MKALSRGCMRVLQEGTEGMHEGTATGLHDGVDKGVQE